MDPSKHQPIPQTWKCEIDGQPFPCVPAKLELLAEHGPQAVAVVVRRLYRRARAWMPSVPAGDLLRQITGWTTSENVLKLLAHPPWCTGNNAACVHEHTSPVLELPPDGGGFDFIEATHAQLVAAVDGPARYGETHVRLTARAGTRDAGVALVPLAAWQDVTRQITDWAAWESPHGALRKQLLVGAC